MTGIIIISFNHLTFTKRCIQSIFKYTDRDKFKICLVDNGSIDGTKEWAKNTGLDRFIDLDKNYGTCYAGNRGREWALEDYDITDIAIVANDHIVSENWLQPLVKMPGDYGNPFTFMSDQIFVEIDEVINEIKINEYKKLRVKYLDKDVDENLDLVLRETYGDYDDFVRLYKNRHIHEPYIEVNEQQWFGFAFYKKYVIEEVGLEDENLLKFSLAGYADVDYKIRLAKTDFKCSIAMLSYVHHWGSITTRKMGLNPDGYRRGYVPDTEGALRYLKNKWHK